MTPNGTRLALTITQDAAHLHLLGICAAKAQWRLVHARTAEEALAILGTQDGMMLDAVLIEQCSDTDIIAALHSRRPALPIIVQIAGMNEVADVLRQGVSDYLLKPSSPDQWLNALGTATGRFKAMGELRPFSTTLLAPLGFGDIVGSDARFRTALAVAAKNARGRAPLLIMGEAGVGKDMVGSAIHAASARDKRPFIKVDCASMAPNMIESDLFGHEKNAFTGAFSRQMGSAYAADGGTLFIDNIDQLPMNAQAGLMRLIEHHELRPLGTTRTSTIDVRILASTSCALAAKVKAEQFREDLFYKINAVRIDLPPLRERAADIAPLVQHLLARAALLPTMRGIGVTDGAMELLNAYPWPGNVRQLQSVLLRAAVGCAGDVLKVSDFPNVAHHVRSQALPLSQHNRLAGGVTLFGSDGHIRPIELIEADVIRLAIGHYGGRMAEVARRLGIGRSTLYRKLVELGISDVA